MEDWVFRRDLIDNRRLRALSRRSDMRGAVQFGGQLLALSVTGTGLYLTWGTWWGVPLFLVHGVLLWGFTYSGQHELLHRTPFRTPMLNDLAVRLTGFFRIWPPDHERYQHFGHHRHTKDPANDPELIGARPLSLPRYLWRLGGQGYWLGKGGTFLRTALGAHVDAYVPDAARPAVVREARLYLLAYALVAALSVYFQSWLAVMLWLGPMAATAPFHPYYALAEHHGLPHGPNILESTRTTLTNPVLRWLSWNMGYHTAHHLFPGVPFHALATLHGELDIPLVRHGYLGFHRDMIRGLWRRDPITVSGVAHRG